MASASSTKRVSKELLKEPKGPSKYATYSNILYLHTGVPLIKEPPKTLKTFHVDATNSGKAHVMHFTCIYVQFCHRSSPFCHR